MSLPSELVAAIELGGTKTVVAVGKSDGTLLAEHRFPTTHPEETLQNAIAWLDAYEVSKIGIGTFGPIRLDRRENDYGTFLQTPKIDWQNFSLTNFLRERKPHWQLALDTDVNAALLAEVELGAARGCTDAVYITVGTGIGAGVMVGGKLLHGTLHPEAGHIFLPLFPGDGFAGVCPFHKKCWEGLASAPAIEKRWHIEGKNLIHHPSAFAMEAWYLAQGIHSLHAILSPQCIILGGGVSQAEGLHAAVSQLLDEFSAGYFSAVGKKLVAPQLEQNAGIIGALLLTQSL